MFPYAPLGNPLLKKIKIFESVSVSSPFVEKYNFVRGKCLLLRNIIRWGIIYTAPPVRQTGGVSGRFVLATTPYPYIWEWPKIKNERLSIPVWVGLSHFSRLQGVWIGLHNTWYPLSLKLEHSFFFGRTFVCLSPVYFGTLAYIYWKYCLHNTVYYRYLLKKARL
jgi:hypothetical protein